MKKTAMVAILIALVWGLSGCATIQEPAVVSQNPEMQKYWNQYQSIKPHNLTDRQQDILAEVNEDLDAAGRLHPDYLKIAQVFPWVDTTNLKVRDKVFLGEVGRDIAGAMMMADRFG